MARFSLASDRVVRLDTGWEAACVEPGAAHTPRELAALSPRFRPAIVPGTAASIFSATEVEDFDAVDVWYRTRVSSRGDTLRFGGLATLADVFLNGERVLSTNDMFVSHACDVAHRLSGDDELMVLFRALAQFDRRTRPRWKTRLVKNSALRHVRTTQFGRMPGVGPLIAPVGPFRTVELVTHGPLRIESTHVRARPDGDGGSVSVSLRVRGDAVRGAKLRVGDAESRLVLLHCDEQRVQIDGSLRLESVERWWPHTHGAQPLYPVSVTLDTASERVELEFGRTGFRAVELDTEQGGFGLSVNGVPVFCRGACVLPLDVTSLDGNVDDLARTLRAAKGAGMNLLRVVGNGVYPVDEFFAFADELGLLVWQDFAFARLDYPDDAAFAESVRVEARQFLDRVQLAPSLAVLCGNSEVEQQVAMLGLDPELGRSALFDQLLPETSKELRPDVPYRASTPSGGALPFHPNRGTSHYFGVGAFRRPLSDARTSDVRFATECLAFSNVPDAAMVDRVLDNEGVAGARWKAGIAHDAGASFDFEDVRDHYLETIFGVSARELRAADPERWLELGRVATGEAMARTIGEFRRSGSRCRGTIIWHLRDLVPGAGCGLIDAAGRPKAAYWFVARAFQPVSLFLVDEGLNGLVAHALNDTARPVAAELAITLLRDGSARIAGAESPVMLPPRSSVELSVDALLGAFADTTYAYRFGPPSHDVVVARLSDVTTRARLADAVYFPERPPIARRCDLCIEAGLVTRQDDALLELRANAFAYAVHVEVDGFETTDDYFHLEPDVVRHVQLRTLPRVERSIRISALNGAGVVTLRASEEAARSA